MSTEAAQTKTSSAAACWNCGAARGHDHFCPACGKIQPLVADADYFAFFGFPRELGMDAEELERRFLQLSWKLHPDNFVRSSEYERELSLERSSQLNDAARTLRDPLSRLEYLLARAGMRREGQNKQQAPPELLEEVFELNESLDELRAARQAGGDAAEMAELTSRLQAERDTFNVKLGDVDEELQGLAGEWDRELHAGGREAEQQKLFERMNEALNRRSYIRNLVQNVQKELVEE